MKHIVILGAGVAGLHAAQGLARRVGFNCRITLVDSSDVHVLRADLYEVATAFSKEITEDCLIQLKSTVATPIMSLVDPDRVQVLHDEVTAIDPQKKRVTLKSGKPLRFDVLIVALGSISHFFGVPGAEKYALPLKSVHDALHIHCALDRLFFQRWKKKSRAPVHITIGGGGATGVEMAAELASALKKLCAKYRFPMSKVRIQLIQSGDELGGLGPRGTEKIVQRLQQLGVKVFRGARITRVSADSVTVMNERKQKKTLSSSLLIWTAGVRMHPVVANLGDAKKGGAIPVQPTLQSESWPSIFAAGDNAFMENPSEPGTRLPMLAHAAQREGELLARNVQRFLEGRTLVNYRSKKFWFILPLGGKYAVLSIGPFVWSGFLPWLLRRWLIFRYHRSTMSLRRAFTKWQRGGELFEGND